MKPSSLHQMQGRLILCQWATHLPESVKCKVAEFSGSLSPMSRQDAHTSVELWLKARGTGREGKDYLRRHYRCYGSGEVECIEPEAMRALRIDAEAWAALQAFELDPLSGLLP